MSSTGERHVLTDDTRRRLRTRGKSTPDLLRARAGDLTDAPDAVLRPADAGEVQGVLDVAARHRVAVVPFGGGTSVTGGLVARREGFAGVVSLDLVRMKRLLATDRIPDLSEGVLTTARSCVSGSSIARVVEPPPSRFSPVSAPSATSMSAVCLSVVPRAAAV